MSINIDQIEKNLIQLSQNISEKTFIYDLLVAYGMTKSTLSLLKNGNRNLSKHADQIVLKSKFFFQSTKRDNLQYLFDQLINDEATYRSKPCFIIVTDYKTLLAIDLKTKKKIRTELDKINKHATFFEDLSPGLGKNRKKDEYIADTKAAEQMATLYDQILEDNCIETDQERHQLNIFFSRLLFCFFAEDTGLFKINSLTDSISSYTKKDGSNLDKYLIKLFKVLNTEQHQRKMTPQHLKKFPFVNGKLFQKDNDVPKFTSASRKMMIACGDVIWAEINLDIFGSIMQAVASGENRSRLGMHYTSLENINKVINPLFLDELRDEFKQARGNQEKLYKLRKRLKNFRIFDPACGSGNFLVITYIALCELERDIIQELIKINPNLKIPLSDITLSQFFGIEIDDFAHEVAILSLWLAKHQMNIIFKEQFGYARATLPLKDKATIIFGNSNQLNWDDVCPNKKDLAIYIIGNPPYLGSNMQSKQQKNDIYRLFEKKIRLDYVACWFLKGSMYIERSNAKLAFISTNSICQGEQVALLWEILFKKNIEIIFCERSFKWSNRAKENAGVICSVIGLGKRSNKSKKIYKSNFPTENVSEINAYLLSSKNTFVIKHNKSISCFPKIIFGNMASDGGHLLLDKSIKEQLEEKSEKSIKFIKKIIGSDEFINGKRQWCLWIEDQEASEAKKIPIIKKLLDQVSNSRKSSKRKSTRSFSDRPHRFLYISRKLSASIIVPRLCSERRKYIPIGFIDKETIIKATAFAIYDAEPWLFGILTSQIHMAWVRAFAGRLKSDIRYSSTLCYNAFPAPNLTESKKETLRSYVFSVIEEREQHPEKTLAELYDPDKMPEGLRQAHHALDIAVDRCYRSTPFTDDDERLEHLLNLYQKMTSDDKSMSKANDCNHEISNQKAIKNESDAVAQNKAMVNEAANDSMSIDTIKKGRKKSANE